VWSMIGAITQATSRMKVTTAVTCRPCAFIPRSSLSGRYLSCAVERQIALGVAVERRSMSTFSRPLAGGGYTPRDARGGRGGDRLLWQGGCRAIVAATTVWKTRVSTTCPSARRRSYLRVRPQIHRLAARIGDGYCTVGRTVRRRSSARMQRREARGRRNEGVRCRE